MKMKFSEPRTLWNAMSPTLFATWTFGMGVFEYPAFHPRQWISICCSVIHFALHLSLRYLTYLTDTDGTMKYAYPDATWVYILIKSIYTAVIMCRGHVKSKNIMACIDKIDTLNELLKKFEIPCDFGILFRKQIIQQVGFSGFICSLELLDIFYFHGNSEKRPWTAINEICYLIITSFIVDSSLSNLTTYIGKRFQHLNTYLVGLNSHQEIRGHYNSWLPRLINDIQFNRRLVNAINEQQMVHSIRQIGQIHRCLCKSARDLNEAFDIQIYLSIGLSFSSVVQLLYIIYDTVTEVTVQFSHFYIIVLSFLVACNIAKIFYILHCCSYTSAEAQRARRIMKGIFGAIPITGIQNENHALSLELMRNPLQFTALGIYSLDFSMIRHVVGTVATYAVITIQMHLNADGETSSANGTISAMKTMI